MLNLKTELASSRSEIIKLQSQLISYKKSSQRTLNKNVKRVTSMEEPRASLRRPAKIDLELLNKDISEIERLIQKRDRALDAYLDTGKPVGVAPQSPVSSRNMSLKAVKRRMKSSLSMSEAAKLKQDLLEIRTKMKEDVALLKRLNNL